MKVNWVLHGDGELYPEPFDIKKAEQFVIGNYKAVDNTVLRTDKPIILRRNADIKKTKETTAEVCEKVTEQQVREIKDVDTAENETVVSTKLTVQWIVPDVAGKLNSSKVLGALKKFVINGEITTTVSFLLLIAIPIAVCVFALTRNISAIFRTIFLCEFIGVSLQMVIIHTFYKTFGLHYYGIKPHEPCFAIDFENNRVELVNVIKLCYAENTPWKAVFECEVYGRRCNICGFDLYKNGYDAQAVLSAVQRVNEKVLKEHNRSITDTNFMQYYKEILRMYYNNCSTFGFGVSRETPALLAPISVNGIKFKPMESCNIDKILYAYDNKYRKRMRNFLFG